MTDWDSLADRKIREAMEDGVFNDLPGKGKPIHWDENPFASREQEAAFSLLKNAGYTLPWIAELQEIEADLGHARRALLRNWRWLARQPDEPGAGAEEWARAQAAFREQIDSVNRRIHLYNLKVPADGFQRLPVDPQREIAILTGGAG